MAFPLLGESHEHTVRNRHLHTTSVVLDAVAVLERMLPDTVVRKNPCGDPADGHGRVDQATGQQTVDLLNDLEPYMKGWSRFHQAQQIIHLGPEKPV